MISDWLYQVRIKVNAKLSDKLRERKLTGTSKEIYRIAENHAAIPVCTFDAFCEYCIEAEREGIDKYPLYDWTKQVTKDPIKKQKHIRSFAFYAGDSQIYEKHIAEPLYTDLLNLYEGGLIEDLTLIDSNPENNPQPPEEIKA